MMEKKQVLLISSASIIKIIFLLVINKVIPSVWQIVDYSRGKFSRHRLKEPIDIIFKYFTIKIYFPLKQILH